MTAVRRLKVPGDRPRQLSPEELMKQSVRLVEAALDLARERERERAVREAAEREPRLPLTPVPNPGAVLFDLEGAAAQLGIGVSLLRRLEAAGEVRFLRVGTRVVVDFEELVRFRDRLVAAPDGRIQVAGSKRTSPVKPKPSKRTGAAASRGAQSHKET